MTSERRATLSRRAFPAGGVRPWRRRIALTSATAVGLTAAGQPFPAALMLVGVSPTVLRYVRRELALGALLAEAHLHDRQAARIPLVDLRSSQL